MIPIEHKKPARVRKTISLPEDLYNATAPQAATFPDYSKYIQDLIERALAKADKESAAKHEEAA